MKKRLLTFLSAALSAGAVSAAAPQQLIDIRTDDVSIVLAARPGEAVYFRHFGSRIDDPAPLADYKSSRRADHGTDDLAYPAMGGRNFREPALRITHADGDMNTDLRYVSHASRQLADPNVTETVVKMSDCCQALDVELVFTAYARENVITTHTVIRNREEGPVTLHNFYSSALTLKADKYLLTHLYGAWAREAQVDHTLLTHGSKSIESMREVRTTHTENPSFMLTLGSESFSENCGEVIAGALAWSGNFRLNFEVDEYDALTVLAGANPNTSEYRLRPGESFTTPEMIYTHSLRGAGGASRNLHDWARNYGVYHAEQVVPTLLNSWEGAYFDFDAKVLKQMIDDAASMGLEMFVLDDGWFGNKYPRNAANAGLGDWQVNRKKLPAGIDDIASYAHQKGLKFGIWIEPEMVNPKSELAEKHPDWIVRPQKREAPETRKQWLLDLSNPAVQDFVFEVFDNTMKLSDKIDYIKWDANRNANNVGSAYLPADEQSRFWIDYAQGFYKVMERIRAKYPDVLIQACASGGGRVEYGALKYFDEFWTSDNTEALSRARIQYGTSLFYPAVVMGSHVSAVPNHQTGNVTPIKFRFDMACAGRLGMELQPKQMTDAEKAFARRAIASYKEYRDIVMQGDLYRIGTPYDENGSYGVLYVSKDKRQAVLFTYSLRYQGRSLIPKFRLDGLDPKAGYAVRELNVDKPRFWFDGKTLSGELLMNAGINPHLSKIYDSAVFILKAQ
ncbi:alpha-galactosidase [Alistipes sp.]|uniref:alpha-galactosidase n=1 Tax=Alistipes sp. TaxID=1872444 RepID=UPI003AB6A191